MKKICFAFVLLFIVNCAGKIDANIPKATPAPAKSEQKLSVEVFSLIYHKVTGTCDSLPILHRMITFSYIPLEQDANDDRFVGNLEIVLDESTHTYNALYREFAGAENIDQNTFQRASTGNFTVVKAVNASSNDTMILDNLGVLTPTITGSRIDFFIKLDSDINRTMIENEVVGKVYSKGTPLITDTCLL